MEKLSIKKQIFESAKALIEKKQADFRQQINRLENDNLDRESDQVSLVQKSQDESEHEISNKLTEQLNFTQRELTILDTIERQNDLQTEVEPGAIIVTSQGTFFISVATDDYKVNGWKVRGLSADAPIYKEMFGKKKGDTFTFREVEYVIEDLF